MPTEAELAMAKSKAVAYLTKYEEYMTAKAAMEQALAAFNDTSVVPESSVHETIQASSLASQVAVPYSERANCSRGNLSPEGTAAIQSRAPGTTVEPLQMVSSEPRYVLEKPEHYGNGVTKDMWMVSAPNVRMQAFYYRDLGKNVLLKKTNGGLVTVPWAAIWRLSTVTKPLEKLGVQLPFLHKQYHHMIWRMSDAFCKGTVQKQNVEHSLSPCYLPLGCNINLSVYTGDREFYACNKGKEVKLTYEGSIVTITWDEIADMCKLTYDSFQKKLASMFTTGSARYVGTQVPGNNHRNAVSGICKLIATGVVSNQEKDNGKS